MSVSFFSLTLFILISDGMSNVLKYFETKPEVTLFLKDGLTKELIEGIQKDLSGYTGVKEIKFISKQKAFDIYKEQNKNNPMLTEMVTPSILPASFEVTVSDPRVLDKIASDYSAKKDQIDEIVYQKDLVNSIINWSNNIKKIGIIVVTTISFFAFFVVLLIISMKITSRKDEIRVSRLLGANSFYVKRPFLLEGVFYGLFGSFMGWLFALLPTIYFSANINKFFNPIIFVRSDYQFFFVIFGLELLIGIFIGYVASYFGVKRYIKF